MGGKVLVYGLIFGLNFINGPIFVFWDLSDWMYKFSIYSFDIDLVKKKKEKKVNRILKYALNIVYKLKMKILLWKYKHADVQFVSAKYVVHSFYYCK